MKSDSHLKQQDGDPQSDHSSDHYSPLPNQTQQTRRPRGFAALTTATGGGGGRKEREKEKERTKLRERHRRAITSRMLAGLRQYGNFPLPARADMNDVLAALAREAGWIVEADGTTFRPSPPPPHMVPYSVRSIESPISSASLKNCSLRSSLDCQPSILRVDESLSPVSLDSVVLSNRGSKGHKYTNANAVDSQACLEVDELMQEVHTSEHGNDFSRTPYVPVYVMLGIGVINNFCQLIDPEGIRQELSHLKSLNVDGVTVDCWWGIVEGWTPQKYEWSGYRDLFSIIKDFDLKLQVVMAFHEYDSDGVVISLPEWIIEIGKENKDIFFTNRQGVTNSECLSWSIDKERALKGRTAIEVYFDMMRSFRTEFDDFFVEGVITSVEIGLGASGELKYPSFSKRMGWSYPGVGEFQCYDKYSLENLRKTAKLRGHSFWGRVPDNSGHYNSKPNETGFFCDKGDYDSYYGRFFLHWYSQALIDHADNVLSLATLAFEDIHIIVKIPSVYWWYRTSSHAAELTAGYYNPINRDGYSQLFEVLKKHSATIKFMSPPGFQEISCEENYDSFVDPEGLSWQVLNTGWDRGLTLAGQNTVPCYDRDGLMRIVEIAKPSNHPDRHHLSFFTFHLPQPLAQTTICFSEINYFIKCMHGEISGN